MKSTPLLRFANKDITVVSLPSGEKQGFYRQSPHPEQSPRIGKWQPLKAITFSQHTPLPAIAETRTYWNTPSEEGVNPGMGNKTLQSIANDLNEKDLPDPAEITWDPKRCNQFIGTDYALEINSQLEKIDQERKTHGQKSLAEIIEINTKSIQQKALNLHTSPYEKTLMGKMVSLATSIAKKRATGKSSPLVPKKLLLAILIINPILHLGTLNAKDAKTLQDYPAKERIEMAYSYLQSLNGAQLKSLLEAIPEKERVQLVEHLPNKLLPPLIPKGMAAKNLNLVPNKELEKGFAKLSQKEFQNTAESIPKPSQDRLFELLIKAIEKSTSRAKRPWEDRDKPEIAIV